LKQLRVEAREINHLFEQVIHRVLESARQELLRQVDRQQLRLRIDVFVARHRCKGKGDQQHLPLLPTLRTACAV
jgi:hypothetical protein